MTLYLNTECTFSWGIQDRIRRFRGERNSLSEHDYRNNPVLGRCDGTSITIGTRIAADIQKISKSKRHFAFSAKKVPTLFLHKSSIFCQKARPSREVFSNVLHSVPDRRVINVHIPKSSISLTCHNLIWMPSSFS